MFFFSLTVLSFAQCKTAKNKVSEKEAFIKPVSNMNQNITISSLNRDRTMELRVVKVSKLGDPAIQFTYAVYDTVTKKIIKKGNYRGSNVAWHDNTSIKLVPYIGMEQKPTSENLDDILLSNTQQQITIINLKN
ncbi:hypothetical protein [Aquimarina sp. I32.4]|uniref:hypothetical protein n=1 Tax=Aquimarina sp. I32.4 TaxID=2053903 RepID=UPI000CDEF7F3|nr:hypothetical protein [Aquimarina sp. I32.4]